MHDENRHLVANKGYCRSCGSDLQSWHRHDFCKCFCDAGSFLDGGLEYIRSGGLAVAIPIYDDGPFEVVRQYFYRAGYGKDRSGPFRYTKLFQMADSYLEALLDYDCPDWQKELVIKEQQYRKQNNITIPDETN